jgi:uncharacterized cupredoxin-like copper-binding protein
MKTELAAGDSTWIELIYTAGPKASKANKSARVTTNDTTLGNVTISFKVEVVEPGDSALKLVADPPMLDFSPIDGKKVRKLETKIENTTDQNIELTVVSAPPDYFDEVELNRSELKPGKEAKLKIELTSAEENKQFHKSITIEGVSEDNSKFRFTVPVVKGVGSTATAEKGKD